MKGDIEISEHLLTLDQLERVLITQKMKPISVRYWNRGLPQQLGYLSLTFKIHRYELVLFTGDYDYEQFYPILKKSRNLNKLKVFIKGDE